VKIRDTGFSLSVKTAPVGQVKFVVTKNHNFKILCKGTPALKPAKTARLTVTFTKPGQYGYTSTVAGDVRRGLKGTFRLTGAAKPLVPGDIKAGKSVFTAHCSVCHVLKATPPSASPGTSGAHHRRGRRLG
jgi:hypothetical protein